MLQTESVAHFIQLPEQILVFDVGVDFRRLDVRMPKRCLHGAPAPADVEQLGGERVPHVVEMNRKFGREIQYAKL